MRAPPAWTSASGEQMWNLIPGGGNSIFRLELCRIRISRDWKTATIQFEVTRQDKRQRSGGKSRGVGNSDSASSGGPSAFVRFPNIRCTDMQYPAS